MGLGLKTQTITNTAMTGIVTSAAVARVTPAVGLVTTLASQQCPDNTSDVINLTGFKGFSITLNVSATATITAFTFTANATTDLCTAVAHGCKTGQKVAASTSSALPAGLTATNYYLIVKSVDTFYVASTLANALAGTKIDITDTGTGTQTMTPAAIGGGGYTLQASNDMVDWVTDVANVAVSADGLQAAVVPTSRIASYKYARIYYAITAGQMTVVGQVSKNN